MALRSFPLLYRFRPEGLEHADLGICLGTHPDNGRVGKVFAEHHFEVGYGPVEEAVKDCHGTEGPHKLGEHIRDDFPPRKAPVYSHGHGYGRVNVQPLMAAVV